MEVGAVGASDREDSTSRDTGRRLCCKISVWLMPASGHKQTVGGLRDKVCHGPRRRLRQQALHCSRTPPFLSPSTMPSNSRRNCGLLEIE